MSPAGSWSCVDPLPGDSVAFIGLEDLWHPKCHGLPLSSCSDVKNIQIAGVVLDCRQCSLRSRGRTGAFSRSDCPQCRPTMGGSGTERNYFVCPPWPSDFFFCHPEGGEHWAPSCVDGGSLLYISSEGHRPGRGSHTHTVTTSLVMWVDALSMELRAKRWSQMRAGTPLV